MKQTHKPVNLVLEGKFPGVYTATSGCGGRVFYNYSWTLSKLFSLEVSMKKFRFLNHSQLCQ